ncbi:hypothetical protein D7Z26_00300 [Cohnella endophytica]|uniref:Uncharacterized protein n=1 Tax=Cohnella endophytica TaxID=2419778 RepID=A0A494YCI0_9BACL|nr:hypothetical protein [Cohnella endophytica]RKP57991.1 hypothetical protein D7Z26_00300 [Cohnella endophytica]
MDNKYNPYKDETIHTTQASDNHERFERQGFNDVLKHYDAVNGFQSPKQLNHFPSYLKQIIRWIIIINLLIVVGVILNQVIHLLKK